MWYAKIGSNYTSLHREICGGFSYAQKEVARCLGNQSGPVLTPAVPSLLRGDFVKNTEKRNKDATTNTSVTHNQVNATAEDGGRSGIGISAPTLYANNA
jgi:hypothetical protein